MWNDKKIFSGWILNKRNGSSSYAKTNILRLENVNRRLAVKTSRPGVQRGSVPGAKSRELINCWLPCQCAKVFYSSRYSVGGTHIIMYTLLTAQSRGKVNIIAGKINGLTRGYKERTKAEQSKGLSEMRKLNSATWKTSTKSEAMKFLIQCH